MYNAKLGDVDIIIIELSGAVFVLFFCDYQNQDLKKSFFSFNLLKITALFILLRKKLLAISREQQNHSKKSKNETMVSS